MRVEPRTRQPTGAIAPTDMPAQHIPVGAADVATPAPGLSASAPMGRSDVGFAHDLQHDQATRREMIAEMAVHAHPYDEVIRSSTGNTACGMQHATRGTWYATCNTARGIYLTALHAT
jgi:hypothetical protein